MEHSITWRTTTVPVLPLTRLLISVEFHRTGPCMKTLYRSR